MNAEKILALIKVLYQMFLRDIIAEHVASTSNPFDDLLLQMLDSVFGYNTNTDDEFVPKTRP